MTVVIILSTFAALFLTWHAGRRAGVNCERDKEYRDLVSGAWFPRPSAPPAPPPNYKHIVIHKESK